MNNKLKEKGHYEIFKTTEDNDILKLDKDEYYAMVETNQGHILVTTDEDHKKKKTLQKGDFYFVDFKKDPTFNDIPHLFLEEGKKYKEFILPKGLPNQSTKRKKIVFTDDKVEEDKVKRHVKNKEEKVEQEESLMEMEKKELDRKAKKMGIKGYSNMRKKELAKKIKEEQK
ncbi:MAG: Rho termination factor N-terminal domain-containing protein [Candidatus Cyclobacteriaceae bacterium M2_1C_046]